MPKQGVTICVNITTGQITGQLNGDQWLSSGDPGDPTDPPDTFAWITNNTQKGIKVTAEDMSGPNTPWFTADNGSDPLTFDGPATGPLADGSNVATVVSGHLSPPLGWTYGSNILANNGHVVVKSTGQEVDRAKAS
jgi:hypothetical protein